MGNERFAHRFLPFWTAVISYPAAPTGVIMPIRAVGLYLLISGATILRLVGHLSAGQTAPPERIGVYMIAGVMVSLGVMLMRRPKAKP